MKKHDINIDFITIELNKLTFTQLNDLMNEIIYLGYKVSLDYTFGRYPNNNFRYCLLIKSPKMLQDQRVKDLLVEYLI